MTQTQRKVTGSSSATSDGKFLAGLWCFFDRQILSPKVGLPESVSVNTYGRTASALCTDKLAVEECSDLNHAKKYLSAPSNVRNPAFLLLLA